MSRRFIEIPPHEAGRTTKHTVISYKIHGRHSVVDLAKDPVQKLHDALAEAERAYADMMNGVIEMKDIERIDFVRGALRSEIVRRLKGQGRESMFFLIHFERRARDMMSPEDYQRIVDSIEVPRAAQ